MKKRTHSIMCSSFIHSFIHSFICQSLLGSCCGQAYAEPWECGIRHVCYPHGTYHLVEDLARKVGEGHTTEHPKYHTEFGLYSGKWVKPKAHLCRAQGGTMFPMALPLGWPL